MWLLKCLTFRKKVIIAMGEFNKLENFVIDRLLLNLINLKISQIHLIKQIFMQTYVAFYNLRRFIYYVVNF